MLMKKNHFLKCAIPYSTYFAVALVLSYVLAEIMVRGNTLIGNAIDELLNKGHVSFNSFLTALLIKLCNIKI